MTGNGIKTKLAPDPEFAELTLERFEKARKKASDKEKRTIFEIASHSRFLARAAVRDPALALFALSNKAKTKSEMGKTLSSLSRAAEDTDDFFNEVRRFKYRRLAQIVHEDINGDDFTATMAELSDLAEAIIEASVARISAETGADGAGKFCVLGMGKLAGRQLNLSSDVDLIYVYEDKGDAQPFVRLAQDLTARIGGNTENGFLYRVDLGLRPGGMKGTIATHTEGVLEHYFYRGETWERIALMKARPVGGDKRLGRELLAKLEPFIYERSNDYSLIEDMAEMKKKLYGIRKERDVKLGAGGIREIEFFTQTLQILSGASKNLRDPNTLSALKKLLRRKTIPPEIADVLEKNYIFLRKVEHNIQLEEEAQTHSVPAPSEKLSRLAARTGFESAEEFSEKLEAVMKETETVCGELFKSPEKETEPKPAGRWEKESVKITEFLTSGDVDRKTALRSLESLGFKNPADALEIIADLESPDAGGGDLRARGLVRKLMGVLFKQAFKGSNADLALMNLQRLMTHQEWKMSIYPLITAAPDTLEIFIKIIGCESPVSSFLAHNPYYINSVALKSSGKLGDKDEIVRSLSKSMAQQRDYEQKLETLRHFKHIETLKLYVAEFEKKTDFLRTGGYLSLLACIVLESALEMARRLTGGVSTAKTCVLGMGKLGGGELGYSSDLDIIVIHEGDETDKYVRLAQKLIGLVSVPDRYGHFYEIDTALRPSGNSGTLVTSFESFKKYNEKPGGARLWERQALIKASHCAGGKKLGGKVMREVERYVYEMPLEKNFHREIDHLRKRMENELAREDENNFDLKKGMGGMVDVEFLVQALQLKHGGEKSGLRTPNTVKALDRLTVEGVIGKRESKTLRDGYIFLGTLADLQGIFKKNNASRVSARDFERLSGEFERVSGGKKLRAKYVSTTRAVREIYEGFFN